MELFSPGTVFFLISTISLAFLLLWTIALIDILRSQFKETNGKLIWVLIVILVPLMGALLYFIIGRRQKVIN